VCKSILLRNRFKLWSKSLLELGVQLIKVAIVGYGLSATVFHLPFISYLNQYTLVAVSSSQTERVLAKYPNCEVFRDAKRMIEQCEADLVVITSPNETHYDLAKLALSLGMHVLLEKPMTATSQQAIALAKLAYEKSLVLSVFHNRRWDGDFLTLQQLIQSGQLGKIKLFKSNFDRFRPEVRDRWREQAGEATGVLYDLGSHLIDQVLCMFGAPLAITANCACLRDGSQAIDYFQLMLHYANMEIVLESNPFRADPNPRFQLQGTKGSYIKYGLDPQEDQLRAGLSPGIPAFGLEAPAYYGKKYRIDESNQFEEVTKIATTNGCYTEFYNQLAMAISSKLTVPVSALDAAKVIKIIELAIQSSDTGKRIQIDLSEFQAENVYV
jgi:predicted dehydrogenase